jgi:hypothetical protein
MADKKYIGKPGKQDDPCWKGYEMVGMKKKGGRKVPNCVPEAADIIAKAKAKIAEEKKDFPWHEDPKNPTRKIAVRKDQYGNTIKNVAKHLAKKAMNSQKNEEVDLEESATSKNITHGYHGNVKVADDSQRPTAFAKMHAKVKKLAHAGGHLQDAKKPNVMVRHFLDSAHGRHIAVDGSDKNITSRFAHFKKSYNPAMHEEIEQVNEYNNYRKAGKDPFAARKQYIAMDRAEKKGVMPGSSTSTADAIAAFKAKGGKTTKFDTKGNVKEELGKDNEWGRPELRKKYAAATPGQESLAADKIPTFDPRYDDVTTQYAGIGRISESYLAEISAKGAIARSKFKARVQKIINDPAKMARAKKQLSKQKAAEKAKEPPHLVMQLRKAVSIGSKVHFQDGQHHRIAPNHADVFMSKYNSAKSSIEKEALQKKAHKSHSEFMKAISEEVHENCGTPDCCQTCETAEMGTHHVDSYEAHRGSGEQISPVISHDDDDIRFQDFDEEEFERELEADIHSMTWDDIADLYGEDEVEYDENPEYDEEDELEEAITPQGRLKKKFNAIRTKGRRKLARNIALRKISTPAKLKSRSIRAARRLVYKRFLRNRDMKTVSPAEKTRIEAQVKRMAPMVARLAVRALPKVRKLEQSRIKNKAKRKR